MTTLTSKHFECIAANLRKSQPTNPSCKLGYHQACTAIATALQEINPKFDRARFMRAVVSVRGEQFELAPQTEEVTA